MEDVEYLCERVAIIDRGTGIVDGPPEAIKRLAGDGATIEIGMKGEVIPRSPEAVLLRSSSGSGELGASLRSPSKNRTSKRYFAADGPGASESLKAGRARSRPGRRRRPAERRKVGAPERAGGGNGIDRQRE